MQILFIQEHFLQCLWEHKETVGVDVTCKCTTLPESTVFIHMFPPVAGGLTIDKLMIENVVVSYPVCFNSGLDLKPCELVVQTGATRQLPQWDGLYAPWCVTWTLLECLQLPSAVTHSSYYFLMILKQASRS